MYYARLANMLERKSSCSSGDTGRRIATPGEAAASAHSLRANGKRNLYREEALVGREFNGEVAEAAFCTGS